ncbi:TPA: hypothetical protein MND73_004304 [Salmonella enterica subsp. houtenae]|nr:hypothetical protein [Salmonella enterica subsp. houtenae]
MIYSNTVVLGKVIRNVLQVPDPQVVAGRWGLLPSDRFETCVALDTAMVGYMQVTPQTAGNPQSGSGAWGIVQTLSTYGAGDDGKRSLGAPPRGSQEWVTQILFMADGSLYTRTRTNEEAFKPFVKRW